MRPIPNQAHYQFGVFTSTQAHECRWTPHDLERAVLREQLIRLRRGAFVLRPDGDLVDPEIRRWLLGRHGVAAALRIPRATVSHACVAALHDLPLLTTPDRPCVTLAPPLRTRPAHLHVHRQPIPPMQQERGSDVALTSVPRMCLDVTREAGLLEGLVVSDAALHRALTTKEELASLYGTLRGAAGLASGRQVIEMANGLSESPLETVSRFGMRSLPIQPELQTSLFGPAGQFLGRADFFWREAGLVGEADGRGKYTDGELYREKQRQDLLAAHGLIISRWDWATAMRPIRLCDQLSRDLRRAYRLREAGYQATVQALRAARIPRSAA